jgi:hypothetical protein
MGVIPAARQKVSATFTVLKLSLYLDGSEWPELVLMPLLVSTCFGIDLFDLHLAWFGVLCMAVIGWVLSFTRLIGLGLMVVWFLTYVKAACPLVDS